jgi:arsenate reductase
MSRTILFLCPHNAAKSLIAAALCGREAAAHGLDLRTVTAGTEPDTAPAPSVVARLAEEGVDVSGHRPRRVTAGDLAGASRIVSMGCDLRDLDDCGAVATSVECWDDVPAPSQDLRGAFRLIEQRVIALVELERAER